MAAYTTYSDFSTIIQKRLENWGFPTETSARDAEILKAANQAKALIDSHLAARYAAFIPFNPVPLLIKYISLHITVYLLAASQQKTGEEYQENYETALGLLKSIAAGEVAIFDETTGQALTESTSLLGVDSETYEDDNTRVFPVSLLGKAPSVMPRTYRY